MSDLADVLKGIAKEYKGRLRRNSSHYVLADLEAAFSMYDRPDGDKYTGVSVVVPITCAEDTFRISRSDGSDFEGEVQLSNGIIVKKSLAKKSGLNYHNYKPCKTMSLCGNQREFSRWYKFHQGE